MARPTLHRWMAVALVVMATAAVMAVVVASGRTDPPPVNRTTALMRFARAEGLERTEPDAAITELRELLAESPEYPGAHLMLGRMLWALKRPQEAIEPLRTAVKLDPEDPTVHFVLGRALLDVNDSLSDAETADALFAALRLDPRVDSSIGRFINDQLQRELELRKNDPALLNLCCRLGESYLARGQLPNALNALFAFGDVLKADPKHPAALDGQARAKSAIAAIRAKQGK